MTTHISAAGDVGVCEFPCSTWLASGESAPGIPARSIAVTEIASGVLRAHLLGMSAGGGSAFLRLAVRKR